MASTKLADKPEPFVTLIEYGSFVLSNPDLATVTVNWLTLFLVIETVLSVSPVPSKVTTAPVISNSDPLITIVALPPALASIFADVVAEPPSNVKLVITGGLSIDFQEVPS